MVRRIYVEKKAPFAVKAKELKNEMSEYLGIEAEEVRVLIRYDVENVSDATFEKATGVKVNWKYGPRREGDIEKIWGNVDKANKVLGWKADTPLEDVLASAWRWQQKLREDGVM